jgi:hypothetical protein
MVVITVGVSIAFISSPVSAAIRARRVVFG